MTIKVIIAALALEGDDERIAARAIQLASQHGARIVAVHVMENLPVDDGQLPASLDSAFLTDMIAEHKTAQLRTLMEAATSAVSLVVEAGKPHAIIEKLAASCKADLLVMGPGIARSLREKMFGSTADRVVRGAPCPIIIVRGDSGETYRHIVIGVDFSRHSQAAAQWAARVSPQASRELLHTVEIPLVFEQSMLKAGTPSDEIKRYRAAKIQAARRQIIRLIADGEKLPSAKRIRVLNADPASALLQASRRRPTDLVAVGTQGANAVAQHLLGSVARKVLAGSKCDVLVVPAGAV